MPTSTFFETFPLYRQYEFNAPKVMNQFPKPTLNLDCQSCKDRRTFVMTNEWHSAKDYINFPSEGESALLEYNCVSCRKGRYTFTVRIADDLKSVIKTGQFPSWTIKPDSNVENMLGKHKSYLRKGLICESQSYGIGAFSYYRRIVEEVIDGLLDQIAQLMSENERQVYDTALAKVKTTRVTAEKIDLVKDLLPSTLRPAGMNPLALLHGVLSQGLHGESDERCLELAAEIREILTFLAVQVSAAAAAQASFTERMKGLLQKKLPGN